MSCRQWTGIAVQVCFPKHRYEMVIQEFGTPPTLTVLAWVSLPDNDFFLPLSDFYFFKRVYSYFLLVALKWGGGLAFIEGALVCFYVRVRNLLGQ